MLVSALVTIIFISALYIWKFSDLVRERATLRFTGKSGFNSVDADAALRLVLFLLLMVPVISIAISIAYLLD